MQVELGISAPISMTARHLANLAPSLTYSAQRFARLSSPSVTFSPGQSARFFAPASTLMPGRIPALFRTSTKVVPSADFWRIVSSYRMTPLMCCPRPFAVNSMSRYARRFSSVLSTLMLAKRLSIVPVDSSAASKPFPPATMARATASIG